jgi:hypothetical protein
MTSYQKYPHDNSKQGDHSLRSNVNVAVKAEARGTEEIVESASEAD